MPGNLSSTWTEPPTTGWFHASMAEAGWTVQGVASLPWQAMPGQGNCFWHCVASLWPEGGDWRRQKEGTLACLARLPHLGRTLGGPTAFQQYVEAQRHEGAYAEKESMEAWTVMSGRRLVVFHPADMSAWACEHPYGGEATALIKVEAAHCEALLPDDSLLKLIQELRWTSERAPAWALGGSRPKHPFAWLTGDQQYENAVDMQTALVRTGYEADAGTFSCLLLNITSLLPNWSIIAGLQPAVAILPEARLTKARMRTVAKIAHKAGYTCVFGAPPAPHADGGLGHGGLAMVAAHPRRLIKQCLRSWKAEEPEREGRLLAAWLAGEDCASPILLVGVYGYAATRAQAALHNENLAQAVEEFISGHVEYPVVVGGDWNMEWTHIPTLNRLVAGGQLVDLHQLPGGGRAVTTQGNAVLDHVLVNARALELCSGARTQTTTLAHCHLPLWWQMEGPRRHTSWRWRKTPPTWTDSRRPSFPAPPPATYPAQVDAAFCRWSGRWQQWLGGEGKPKTWRLRREPLVPGLKLGIPTDGTEQRRLANTLEAVSQCAPGGTVAGVRQLARRLGSVLRTVCATEAHPVDALAEVLKHAVQGLPAASQRVRAWATEARQRRSRETLRDWRQRMRCSPWSREAHKWIAGKWSTTLQGIEDGAGRQLYFFGDQDAALREGWAAVQHQDPSAEEAANAAWHRSYQHLFPQQPSKEVVSQPQQWKVKAAQLNLRAAAGADGWSAMEVHSLPTEAFEELWNLLQRGVPAVWQEVTVAALAKEGKEVPAPLGVRPITVLPVLRRLQHSVVAAGVRASLQHQLHPRQFANKRGVSAVDCVADLRAHLELSRRTRRHVYVAALDLKKCFDTLPRAFAGYALAALGYGADIVRLICDAPHQITRRWVISGKVGEPWSTTRGSPQGSSLSVIHCDVVILTLLRRLDEVAVLWQDQQAHAAFQDDVTLVAWSPEALERALLVVEDWAKDVDMQLEVAKTVFATTDGRTFDAWRTTPPRAGAKVRRQVEILGTLLTFLGPSRRQEDSREHARGLDTSLRLQRVSALPGSEEHRAALAVSNACAPWMYSPTPEADSGMAARALRRRLYEAVRGGRAGKVAEAVEFLHWNGLSLHRAHPEAGPLYNWIMEVRLMLAAEPRLRRWLRGGVSWLGRVVQAARRWGLQLQAAGVVTAHATLEWRTEKNIFAHELRSRLREHFRGELEDRRPRSFQGVRGIWEEGIRRVGKLMQNDKERYYWRLLASGAVFTASRMAVLKQQQSIPLCKCGQEATVKHVLWKCPANAAGREEHLAALEELPAAQSLACLPRWFERSEDRAAEVRTMAELVQQHVKSLEQLR